MDLCHGRVEGSLETGEGMNLERFCTYTLLFFIGLTGIAQFGLARDVSSIRESMVPPMPVHIPEAVEIGADAETGNPVLMFRDYTGTTVLCAEFTKEGSFIKGCVLVKGEITPVWRDF